MRMKSFLAIGLVALLAWSGAAQAAGALDCACEITLAFTPERDADGASNPVFVPPEEWWFYYPAISVRLREQGTVVLNVMVRPDGTVGAAEIARSSNVPRLDAAALEWTQNRWTFQPALRNGQAVEVLRQLTVAFSLKPQP
jgi:TonB family protein